jgi:uracil-DNA glycosylase
MPHVGKMQIPLRVAYAITIHKSQGASIDSAIVDIGKNTFEYGQAYVALSRVRSLDGLYLHALDTDKIRTCPRVLEFYRGIKTTSTVSTTVVPTTAVASTTVVPTASTTVVPTIAVASTTVVPTTSTTVVPTVDSWDLSCVHSSWLPVLEKALSSNPLLESAVRDARSKTTVYPAAESVFAALAMPIDSVKVVILGQDPYHGPGQAMGLSFAVPNGVPAPPSLKNIMKEIQCDIGKPCSSLLGLPAQGVLMLNTLLTVEQGKPLSHENIGWTKVTDAIISELANQRTDGLVWMLWGRNAQCAKKLIPEGHHILETVHPSPLSAYRGFFGSKHFSKANQILGANAIQWTDV